MFINYRQEQWPEWLGMAEFAYNNKMHSSTRTLPFKANYRQNPRMGFKGKKKKKYKGTEKFVEKMKEVQKKVKVALGKVQEEMKKYANKRQGEVNNYKVRNLVMLSTKDLKYQMVGRRTEKLMKRFIEPYRIKKIVLSNVVELELPNIVKMHLVVNVSKIRQYIEQVKGQKKKLSSCHN